MNIISDLHLHGRYAQACSKNTTIELLSKYTKIKGIDLLGTGDAQHPKWNAELKKELTNNGEGIYTSKQGQKFILTTEISFAYTQAGKGRRIHLVVWFPDFEILSQFTEFLLKKGRIDYDGRPIFGMPCTEFVEQCINISKDIEIIPAHCLLGDTKIHTNYSLKNIKDICKDDFVYTHNNKWQRVTKVLKRKYTGKIYKIRPWYFTEGLKTTPEHPFYAIKSYKCNHIKGLCKKECSRLDYCKKRRFEQYHPEWIPASELKQNDFLIYPRFCKVIKCNKIQNFDLSIKLCRIIGYYLAEGYVINDAGIGFSFAKNKDDYVKEIIESITDIFNKKTFKIDLRKGKDIVFFSKELNKFFSQFYNSKIRKANTKSLPNFMLTISPDKQSEILRCWYRGDKGYTVSRELMNQMKIICLRLGIIPNIYLDTVKKYEQRDKHFIGNRQIKANHYLYSLNHLSFFEDNFELLKDAAFKKLQTKMSRKHGWIDKKHIYIPIRKIELEKYNGLVYNLEVEKDKSYTSEFACIHNCWTPYFGVFGSKSGFDSLKDCFQDQVKNIHAIETGISSDPSNNWRIQELDNYSIVSFSDAHSYWPHRLGREATIFDMNKLTYKELIKAIRENKIVETIEFYPEEGRYHYDGHKNCKIVMNPQEAIKNKNLCPTCGKLLTIGVAHRIEELATRPQGFKHKNSKPFRNLIPLTEVIASAIKQPITSKKVMPIYDKLIEKFGSEFNILLKAEDEEIKKIDNEKIAEYIIKNKHQQIKFHPGYDGEYGHPIFEQNEEQTIKPAKPKKEQKGLEEF